MARSSQRDVNRNVRDIEREIAALKREEAKLVLEIKKAAKGGNEAGTRILAKQLVRLRGQITQMHTHQANLRGVGLSVTSAATAATVGASMASAGKAMAAVGAAADPRKMQQQMQQFSRENAKMEMTSEMMDSSECCPACLGLGCAGGARRRGTLSGRASKRSGAWNAPPGGCCQLAAGACRSPDRLPTCPGVCPPTPRAPAQPWRMPWTLMGWRTRLRM